MSSQWLLWFPAFYRAKATQRNLSMWLRSGVQICCSLWQNIHQCKSCSFFSDTQSEHLSADKEVEATISSWWKEIKLNPLLCVVVSCGLTRSQASSGRWALKVQKDQRFIISHPLNTTFQRKDNGWLCLLSERSLFCISLMLALAVHFKPRLLG